MTERCLTLTFRRHEFSFDSVTNDQFFFFLLEVYSNVLDKCASQVFALLFIVYQIIETMSDNYRIF